MTLFSEEVIRSGPAFALSLLLRHLDPLLRQAAGLGGWQVDQPGQGRGAESASSSVCIAVQGERFAEPTVLIADSVGGQ